MDTIWESITDWLKEILTAGIISNLSGMFDSTNQQVSQIVGDVGCVLIAYLASRSARVRFFSGALWKESSPGIRPKRLPLSKSQ